MSYITIYLGYYNIVTKSCDRYVPVSGAFLWNCLPQHIIATGLQSFTSSLMACLHLHFYTVLGGLHNFLILICGKASFNLVLVFLVIVNTVLKNTNITRRCLRFLVERWVTVVCYTFYSFDGENTFVVLLFLYNVICVLC